MADTTEPSQKNGDHILTISSPSGTVMKNTLINLLNKLVSLSLSKFALIKMADCYKTEAWALGTRTLISSEEAHFHGGGSFLQRRFISTEEVNF